MHAPVQDNQVRMSLDFIISEGFGFHSGSHFIINSSYSICFHIRGQEGLGWVVRRIIFHLSMDFNKSVILTVLLSSDEALGRTAASVSSSPPVDII